MSTYSWRSKFRCVCPGFGRRYWPLVSLCLLLGALSGCAVRGVIPTGDVLSADAATAARAVLRHGDWLVTRGIHATDNAVALATNMPLSHAALYDAEHERVIEADASGVHYTPLDAFFAKTHRLLVIRPQWAGAPGAAGDAVRRARSLVGSGYNFAGLAGINQMDRYYCTQLALEAYRPFMREAPDNPFPRVIKPGQMYFWGRILYDSGP